MARKKLREKNGAKNVKAKKEEAPLAKLAPNTDLPVEELSSVLSSEKDNGGVALLHVLEHVISPGFALLPQESPPLQGVAGHSGVEELLVGLEVTLELLARLEDQGPHVVVLLPILGGGWGTTRNEFQIEICSRSVWPKRMLEVITNKLLLKNVIDFFLGGRVCRKVRNSYPKNGKVMQKIQKFTSKNVKSFFFFFLS